MDLFSLERVVEPWTDGLWAALKMTLGIPEQDLEDEDNELNEDRVEEKNPLSLTKSMLTPPSTPKSASTPPSTPKSTSTPPSTPKMLSTPPTIPKVTMSPPSTPKQPVTKPLSSGNSSGSGKRSVGSTTKNDKTSPLAMKLEAAPASTVGDKRKSVPAKSALANSVTDKKGAGRRRASSPSVKIGSDIASANGNFERLLTPDTKEMGKKKVLPAKKTSTTSSSKKTSVIVWQSGGTGKSKRPSSAQVLEQQVSCELVSSDSTALGKGVSAVSSNETANRASTQDTDKGSGDASSAVQINTTNEPSRAALLEYDSVIVALRTNALALKSSKLTLPALPRPFLEVQYAKVLCCSCNLCM